MSGKGSLKLLARFLSVLPVLFLILLPFEGESKEGEKPKLIEGGVLSKNVHLSGEIVISKDLYVPRGVTVNFDKGSVVRFAKSVSTKVEPENLLPGTEITIRGNVFAEGASFIFDGEGGLVVDGGFLSLKNSTISGAEFGILLISGRVKSVGAEVSDCLSGIMIASNNVKLCRLEGEHLRVRRCRRGAILPEGFKDEKILVVKSSLESGTVFFGSGLTSEEVQSPGSLGELKGGFSPDNVIEDLFIDGDFELTGDILIKGVVRVAPGAHLKIKPGARVFFDFKDTNGDGIGESGLFLQGTLIVEGTESSPVVFASAAGSERGLWDSINFMASDLETNRIEHAVILDSYRGLHSHFSDVHFKNVRIYKTFRGVQFQESKVKMENLGIFDSISALRCRDSDVWIAGFHTEGNVSGANFLRVKGDIRQIIFAGNLLYGLRLRESDILLGDGRVTGGLYSFSLQEGVSTFRKISQSGAVFAGLQAQDARISFDVAHFKDNKVYGLSFKRGKYVLKNVKISGSGVKKMNLEENPEVIIE